MPLQADGSLWLPAITETIDNHWYHILLRDANGGQYQFETACSGDEEMGACQPEDQLQTYLQFESNPIEACINEPVCFTYEMSIPSEDIGVYYDFYTTLLDHGTLEFYPNFLQYLNGYVHKSGLICFTPYEGVTGNYSTPFTVQIKSENGAILGELQDQPLCH